MSSVKPKVLLAMSGGVDSSVAAALLLERGYDVVGCFMRLGSPGDAIDVPVSAGEDAACDPRKARLGKQGCCSVSDAADAKTVAAQLGIPLYVVNFRAEFGRVMDYFADEYVAGRTPNPCVRCNDWLKFGKLHEYARNLGARFVASGHYARVEEGRLKRGLDIDKDQSYVLFGAARDRLGEMLLPIGAMRKAMVREEAKRRGLPVFDKPDSQEICFVPDQDYAAFVERRRPGAAREGDIVDAGGAVVGTHGGQHRFTIGQRRGVGVALGYPVFVVGKDVGANRVTVGPREGLMASGCEAWEANWLVDMPRGAGGAGGADGAGEWVACTVQVRSKSRGVAGRVRVLDDGAAATPSGRRGRFEVRFDEPQEAVTSGQAVVAYAGETVLGGGWIGRVESAAGHPASGEAEGGAAL